MINRKQLVQIALFFMLLHPLYVYVLNTFKIYQLPLTIVSIIILIVALIMGLKIKKKAIMMCMPWMLLFTYMILNNKGEAENFVFYFSMIIIMLVLSMVPDWQESAIKIIAIMTFPHVFFTVLLFFIPTLYSSIRPFISADNIMFEGYKTALTGHYSTNAIYISISLIVFGAILFHYGLKNTNKKYMICFVLSIFAILLTTKRGPLIFSVVAIFITYILVDKNRISSRFVKILMVLMIFGVIFYLLSKYIPSISETFVRFSEDGDSGRSVMYLLAINMFLENPILGKGTGAYKLQYHIYLAQDVQHMYLNAHNVYLQLLAENGILGLVLFVYAAFYTLLKSISLLRKFHKEGTKNEKTMYTSVAFQIYFLLYCLTGNPLYDSMMYIPYFIFCAVSYSMYIREKL